MSLLESALRATSTLASTVATVGSVVVHHDEASGKDSLNVVPALLWFYGLSVVGCSLSHGESFSTCVTSILSVFGG